MLNDSSELTQKNREVSDPKTRLHFIFRIYISLALYAYLAMGITWLDTTSNMILAIGSRMFVFAMPLLIFFRNLRALLFFVGSAGCFLIAFNSIYGALLLALSISAIGFILKSDLMKTHQGSISNMIAVNYGSLFSGILLFICVDKNILSFIFGIVFIIIAMIELFHKEALGHATTKMIVPTFGKISRKSFAWILIGMASGIHAFSLFAFLSRYLLDYYESLPKWYGLLVALNSIVIILFQTKVYHFLIKRGIKYSFIFLMLGIFTSVVPNLFYAQLFIGSILWVLAFSVFECVNACLDYHSSKDNDLFFREIGLGLGIGLAVLLGRTSLEMHYIAFILFSIFSMGVFLYGKNFTLDYETQSGSGL